MRTSSCGMSPGRARRISIALCGEGRSKLHPVAARAFGGVLSGVGMGDEVLPPDSESVARGDPDTAGEVDGSAEPGDAHLRDAAADTLGDRVRCGRVCAAQDHDEFFTAVT